MGKGVACVCTELGCAGMTAINRDGVLSKILTSCATSSPDQMGNMIWALCFALSHGTPVSTSDIVEKNLRAVIDAVLHSRSTSSLEQVGAMFDAIFRILGTTIMLPARRQLLKQYIARNLLTLSAKPLSSN